MEKIMSKKITKIALATIIIMILMACFRFSYASALDDIASAIVEGVAGLLLLGIQQLAAMIFAALNLLTNAITGTDASQLALSDVIFNRCNLTSANFFPQVWVEPSGTKVGTTMQELIDNISKYYVIVRNLSIAILLGILLYVGIRMAISTVASEEAKYKKMLYDWVISLVLVFMLHFIIIITFLINNQLVAILSYFDPGGNWNMAQLAGEAMVPGAGMDELIVYGAFSIANISFVLMYVKRTIILGFLIIIAPLITITYSIDKMGDGKSQALNTWLREFIFTIIIQPFHCIIYIVFYGATVGNVQGLVSGDETNLGKMIFAAATAFFMLKAEGIVKKIFGIQPSKDMGTAIGAGAMALTAATKMFGKGKGNKIDKSKGNMPTMKNNVDTKEEKTDKDKEKEKQENAKDENKDKNKDKGTSGGTGQPSESSNSGNSGSSGGPVDTDDSGDVADAADVGSGSGDSAGDSSSSGGRGRRAVRFLGGVAATPVRMLGSGLLLTQHGKRAYDRNGKLGGYLGRKISGAATLAGMIAGGTVGDARDAVSIGIASGTIASNIRDDFSYKNTEAKLIHNEEVFAGAYNDFADAYRAEHGDVDDAQIRSAARKIYDGDGQDLEHSYERDFYSQMKDLATGGEIMGYKNGYDYINETMKKVQDEIITPNSSYRKKDYNVKPKNK